MLSEKKRRSDLGLHIFLWNLWCPLKKKGLHFDFASDFPIFLPKSGCSLKKKGLHSDRSLNKHLQRIQKLYVLFSRGVPKIEEDPKKRGPEATASFASPNIHHWSSPLNGNCRDKATVYQATVQAKDQSKNYIGLCETEFIYLFIFFICFHFYSQSTWN